MNIVVKTARVALRGIQFALTTSDVPEEQLHRTSIYLLVTGNNVSGATCARVIGVSKQYVSKVLRQVEDAREDKAYDKLLSKLEQSMFGDPS